MAQELVSELLDRLQPYVAELVSGSPGVTTAAPSPHDLNSVHHTGTISDAQAPQFLLADGSRDLTGNLTVSAGVTIDGVDISDFKAAYDIHTHLSTDITDFQSAVSNNTDVAANTSARHNAVTIGTTGLSAKLAVDANQVLTLGTIAHSDLTGINANDHHEPVTIGTTGLSGKLAVDSNQQLTLGTIAHSELTNVVANEHINHSTVSISAGTGLVGGGDLTATRTLSFDYDVVNSHWTQRHYFDGGLDASDAEIYGQIGRAHV